MGIIGVALARQAETAREIVIPFTCLASAAVGDLVYQDPLNDKSVIVATSNTAQPQVFGVIKEKPGTTDANVLILGIVDGFSALAISGRVYLSTTGTITQTIPTTGFVHNLGFAVSETEVLFIPNNVRAKRA